MLKPTERAKVKEEVLAAYKEKYPSWTSTKVTELVENAHFGTIVAVASDQSEDGEICVHRKDGVIIFDTTPEVVRYLDMKARQVISLRDWLTAIIVVFILILFSTLVFIFKREDAISLVITAMVGILGTYAGVTMKTARKDD